MKIYIGKNKRGAKEISLKELLRYAMEQQFNSKRTHEIESGRFSDDSASWLQFRSYVNDGAIDINIGFNPDNENELEDFTIHKSLYKLDEENMKQIL